MKKAFTSLSVFTLALVLFLSLCACGQKQAPVPTEAPTQAPTKITQAPSEEVTQAHTDAPTKATTKPATKATTKPTTKPAPKPTTCNHSYKDATCIAPKTCTKCGVTQGSTNGHSWESATCTTPKTCSVCGKTEGSAKGHKWQAATCSTPKTCSICGETSGSAGSHSWKDATCTEPQTCSVCGETYGSAVGHDWEDATCSEPETCSDCGATNGQAQGHDYSSYDGKCRDCDAVDPIIDEMLAKCSLELPSLPQTVNYYGWRDELYATVQVTAISCEFEYDYNDKSIGITAKFSGTKTYDHQGRGQSDSCKIGWKLYDPDGNVVRDSTFYSPAVAEGESFANKEETLLYTWDNMEPGAYKLVLLDVN